MSLPTFILRQGDVGQEVARLQQGLITRGAFGVDADGEFGAKTAQALRALQDRFGLRVDGEAGPATLGVLGIAPLLGIDVSHYQGRIDWPTSARSVAFAYCKASQDQGGPDPSFERNVRGASATGLPTGAYHFAMPDSDLDADAEAAAFLARAMPLRELLTLPAMLDLEANPGHLAGAALTTWVLRWCELVAAALGQVPLVYSARLFAQDAHQRLSAAGIGNWIAAYRGPTAVDPGVAGCRPAWAIWQFSDQGEVPGIAGHVDLDWLAGGQAALQLLLRRVVSDV